jgi:phage replication O-like protein O
MASPQKENGYTAIANELLEQFSMPGMSGSELRVVLFITRKTYGYQKTRDRIALSQFEAGTGMNRAQAVRTLKELIEKKIVIKDGGFYKLNKNYEEWIVSKRIPGGIQKDTSIQKDTTASIQKDTETSIQKDTHKRKKENLQKKEGGGVNPLGAEIIKELVSVDPKNKNYYSNTTQREACDFLIAEYGLDTVLSRVHILQQTNGLPYFPTITTPLQLRDKWVQLETAAKRRHAELLKPKRQVIL